MIVTSGEFDKVTRVTCFRYGVIMSILVDAATQPSFAGGATKRSWQSLAAQHRKPQWGL